MNAVTRRSLLQLARARFAEGSDAVVLPVVLGAVALTAGTMTWLMEHGSYDTWAAIPTVIGLVLISVPLLRKAAAVEADPRIARLLWLAFCLKLFAALPRYVVAFDVYDGQADAAAYSRIGSELARQFRLGNFDIDIGRPIQGTGFVQILTGVVYSVIGATSIGGFFVFSWVGFWGLYLFHRAFVRACPQGDHHRYALLVFFLPSLLFWPSSIGKEAWMCFGLGVVAYAGARLLTGSRGGLLLLTAGSFALGMVRPHVATIAVFAVLLAYVVRRPPDGPPLAGYVTKFLVIVVLGSGMVFAVGQLGDFFGVDKFNEEAVENTLDETSRRTGQGGSEFEAGSTTDLSPSRFPEAFAGVLFRPFPWQANNAQALIAAAESGFTMLLFIVSWRRILGALRSVVHTPYVVLCFVYTILFVYGFSAFSNAGILVRQRVQVMPLVLVLLCLPPLAVRLKDSVARDRSAETSQGDRVVETSTIGSG